MATARSCYTPDFTLLNTATEEGAPLLCSKVDETRQLLYGANYHKGEVNVYKILEDGSIEATDSIYHDEPVASWNQDKPHVHYTDLTPDQRFSSLWPWNRPGIYLWYFRRWQTDRSCRLRGRRRNWSTSFGLPSQITNAYLVGELDSSLTALRQWSRWQFWENPKGANDPCGLTDFNSGAAVRISNDGRLFSSNRGHNSIAVLK